jgi:nucleoside-diphosphate-sugar epimerase
VPEKIPIPEDHPQRAINPYGCSKLFVEQLLADLDRACGLRWVSLRYFNAAGADPAGEIGEAHEPETHLIPLVLRAALMGSAVRIFDDYDTPDGTCVAQGGGPSCALNLANERGYSVREVHRDCAANLLPPDRRGSGTPPSRRSAGPDRGCEPGARRARLATKAL